MDLMYNYEGNLGEKNGRINPLFVYRDKSIYLSVLVLAVFFGGGTCRPSFTGNSRRGYFDSKDLILHSFIVKFLESVIPFTSQGSLF